MALPPECERGLVAWSVRSRGWLLAGGLCFSTVLASSACPCNVRHAVSSLEWHPFELAYKHYFCKQKQPLNCVKVSCPPEMGLEACDAVKVCNESFAFPMCWLSLAEQHPQSCEKPTLFIKAAE